MATYKPLIEVKLDVTTSAVNVNDDLKKLEKRLDKVNIIGTLNPTETLNNINNQIEQINANGGLKKIKVDVDLSDLNNVSKQLNSQLSGSGGLSNIAKAGTQAGSQMATNVVESFLSKLRTSNKLKNANVISDVVGRKSLINTTKSIDDIKSKFMQLKDVVSDVKITDQNFSSKTQELNHFVAEVKLTNGQIEKLEYNLRKVGKQGKQAFKLSSLNSSENGVIKLTRDVNKAVSDYTAKLNKFKETNNGILSGIGSEVANFESKLNGLMTGKTTVDEVANAFNNLKSVSSQITRNLDATGGSLNKVTTAVNKIRDLPTIIKKMEIDWKSLKVAPIGDNFGADTLNNIKQIKQSFFELQQIESQSGRGLEWSEKYKELQLQIAKTKSILEVLHKEERSDPDSGAKRQLNYYNKIEQCYKNLISLQRKKANASGEEYKLLAQEENRIKSRISYSEKQLSKLNLESTKHNDIIRKLEQEYQLAKKLSQAKLFDKATSQEVVTKLIKDISVLDINVKDLEKDWSHIFVGKDANAESSLTNLKNNMKELIELEKKLTSGNLSEDELVSTYSKIKEKLVECKNAYSALDKVRQSSNKSINFEATKAQAINKIETYIRKNTRATKEFGKELEILRQKYYDVANIAEKRALDVQFTKLDTRIKEAGKDGMSLFSLFQEGFVKLRNYFTIATIFYTAVNNIKKLATEVINVDNSMVSLKKVCEGTNTQFDNFLQNAIKSSQELGAKLTDVIDATSEFSRLGYSLDDSEILGKTAVLYKNVGDGISASEASQSIISTMKAFNINAKDVIEIVDKFNAVGNNFAISSAGIGQALERSASSLAEGRNNLSQSIALITGANDVVQNPDTVGTAWKTIAMRIRGAETELEEAGLDTEGLVTSTAKLQSLIKGMTGFDILEKDQKTFKSTYDIICGIAEKYKDLKDIDKANYKTCLYVQKCA